MSRRKAAASRFRKHIRRSNELQAGYLADPDMLAAYDRFANWQLEYLLPSFGDLHGKSGYTEALEFTMHDLAGVGIIKRDDDLERASPAITTMLPRRALETIAAAAKMNARVLEVNLSICRCLMIDGQLPEHITEQDYWIACRNASSLEECVELVHLIIELGRTLSALIEMPVLGVTLRAMRAPAHAAGFGALQEFLETGYHTFKNIPDIQYFLETIETRMIEIFEKIFTQALPTNQ